MQQDSHEYFESNCRLCRILLASRNNLPTRRYDSIFYQSTKFSILPALGALTSGHSMIISNDHYPSLLSMSYDARHEFIDICKLVSGVWTGEKLTFIEHGASCTTNSGPCIAHTHINVIPGVPEGALDFEALGHSVIAQGGLEQLPTPSDAYFLFGQPNEWSVYDNDSAPSQHIRQLLFRHFGLPYWDWRAAPMEDISDATYTIWKEALTTHEQ